MPTLTLHHARLRGRDGTWRIEMADGLITAVLAEPEREKPPGTEADGALDAAGNLVVPPFASAHLHLDKVHTLAMVGEEALTRYSRAGMGDAMGAIQLAAAVKERYDRDWIRPNVANAVTEALAHGISDIRAFANTDTRAGLEGVAAVLDVRAEFAGRVDLQVTAFPQDGLVRDPGAEELLRAALERGADLVGGIPWIELTDDDAREHIRSCFDLAVEFDRDVAMLVDDAGDPSLRTTEMLASEALRRGWEGRVSACHARALGTYPEPTLRRLIALAQQAGVTFVTNPHTGPLHLPFETLLDAGLTVALGQDDIEDAYYPYGQQNLLEVAFLASHVTHQFTLTAMDRFLDMVGPHARRAMGLEDRSIAVGEPADLLVLEGDTVRRALTVHRAPRAVVRGGEVVATTVTRTTSVNPSDG